MPNLRLGTYKLPAAEVVLVQTLFRLYAHAEGFHWSYAAEPPFDALLADGTTEEGQSPEVDRLARAVLRLTRIGSENSPGTMARPIRADHLQDWLLATERQLRAAQPAAAPAPAAAVPAAAPAANRPPPSASAAAAPSLMRFKLLR